MVGSASGSFQAFRCGRFVAGIAGEPRSNSAGGHPAGAVLRRGSRERSSVPVLPTSAAVGDDAFLQALI